MSRILTTRTQKIILAAITRRPASHHLRSPSSPRRALPMVRWLALAWSPYQVVIVRLSADALLRRVGIRAPLSVSTSPADGKMNSVGWPRVSWPSSGRFFVAPRSGTWNCTHAYATALSPARSTPVDTWSCSTTHADSLSNMYPRSRPVPTGHIARLDLLVPQLPSCIKASHSASSLVLSYWLCLAVCCVKHLLTP